MEKKAEYQLTTSVNEGMFEIIMTGKVSASSIEKLHNEVTAVIKANGIQNLLVDIRAVDGRFRIAETYLYVIRSFSDRPKVNNAVVDIPDNANFLSFYDDAAINVGLSVKGFSDIDAARDWLKSKKIIGNRQSLTLVSFHP
ncbi:MAG: STAS/SEC14 domain-containing protein [Smithella sp.]